MPLRPVSELGLVDLTDLALPDEAPASRRSSGSGRKPTAKKSSGTSRRPTQSAKGKIRGTATSRRTPTSSAKGKPRTPPVPGRQRSRSQIGLRAVTGAIALAGGVVLGRAVAHR